MIVVVTPNVALDVTYEVPEVRVGASHRVTRVLRRAGGKGVNVARILSARGLDVVVTGFVGGPTGQVVRDDLAVADVPQAFVPIDAETRQTCTVVSGRAEATAFNEPGPHLARHDWAALADRVSGLMHRASVLICSGSLPPGVPDDGYARLVGRARLRDVACIVDAAGAPLLRSLPAGPEVVKPNAEELRAATGEEDPVTGAQRLRDAGARAVVASLCARGLLAVAPEGTWRAAPSHAVTGNPTGAGDAAVAALGAGLACGQPWPGMLREAVALSAAAASAPVAGEVDDGAYHAQLRHVTVESIAGRRAPVE